MCTMNIYEVVDIRAKHKYKQTVKAGRLYQIMSGYAVCDRKPTWYISSVVALYIIKKDYSVYVCKPRMMRERERRDRERRMKRAWVTEIELVQMRETVRESQKGERIITVNLTSTSWPLIAGALTRHTYTEYEGKQQQLHHSATRPCLHDKLDAE